MQFNTGSWQSFSWTSLFSVLLLATHILPIHAIDLDINDEGSIKEVTKKIAKGMTKYYTGYKPGDVPGNLPQPPYYWWECGAMFNALIDYWSFTGDETYNDITKQGMIHQASDTNNYMPSNQTKSLGNDDQAFWGMAAMSAAERNFPNPPDDKPGWLALVQGTFNSQAERWDDKSCGGGLRWQIFVYNNGYDYKNTVSNGGLFNMAARLAMYTKNQSYADWGEKIWDWCEKVGFIGDKYQVFDGASETTGCTNINRVEYSYNAGLYLHGAANMYNYTNADPKWEKRLRGMLEHVESIFFKQGTNIMYEQSCEPINNCNTDQNSFKAYMSRWMGATVQIAPFTFDLIMPKLQASAEAAAKACVEDGEGYKCGLKWTTGTYNDPEDLGTDMSALEVIQSVLSPKVDAPVTHDRGGTSKGDPSAGKDDSDKDQGADLGPITTGDKAGAGILTFLVLGGIIAGSVWAVIE